MNTLENKNYFEISEFHYTILNDNFFCCDEWQSRNFCIAHDEEMGCPFCRFDYTEKCECKVYE
jgi:hypothetical protein